MSLRKATESTRSRASQLDKSNQARVLVCGLSTAGKRTVLRAMKRSEIVGTILAAGGNLKAELIGDQATNRLEMGGRCVIRPLRQHQYENTRALVFVVDSTDRNRIKEACEELHRLTNEEELQYKPVLILANKQELPNAMKLDELRDQLALASFDHNTKWHLQGACAMQGKGIQQGFQWLGKTLAVKTDLTTSLVETINDLCSHFPWVNVKN